MARWYRTWGWVPKAWAEQQRLTPPESDRRSFEVYNAAGDTNMAIDVAGWYTTPV
jgi:hypothetical protein